MSAVSVETHDHKSRWSFLTVILIRQCEQKRSRHGGNQRQNQVLWIEYSKGMFIELGGKRQLDDNTHCPMRRLGGMKFE